MIRVCDAAGDVIETHEHKGDFKEWLVFTHVTQSFLLKRTRRRNPTTDMAPIELSFDLSAKLESFLREAKLGRAQEEKS